MCTLIYIWTFVEQALASSTVLCSVLTVTVFQSVLTSSQLIKTAAAVPVPLSLTMLHNERQNEKAAHVRAGFPAERSMSLRELILTQLRLGSRLNSWARAALKS